MASICIRPIGEFARSVFTLMGGTLLAQLVMIAVSPLLTRIYSPADFGIFVIFVAIGSVAAIASTGRFELAINLPNSNVTAAHLVCLAAISVSVFAITASALVWILFSTCNLRNISWIYSLIPISVAFIGFGQILNYWLNRQKRYKDIAVSRTAQSALFAASSIYLGAQGWQDGMVIGYLLGQLAGLLFLMVGAADQLWAYRRRFRISTLFRTALRYREFPLLLIIAHSLNMISSRIAILLMPVAFGAAAAGLYSLTQQVIGLPMQLVGAAIGDVFRQHASESYRLTGSCQDIYIRTFRALAAIYIIPFVVLVLYSPIMFSFAFGDQWSRAGVMSQILAPMFYLQFLSTPLSSMFVIAERQREDLLWQSALITLTVSSLILGWRSASLEATTALFSASYCIMYCASLVMTFRFAKGNLSGVPTRWK